MRSAIANQMNSMGVSKNCELHETLLIRDGLFCGRKYQYDGYTIVWFLEEDQLKIFSPVGELISSTSAISFMNGQPVHTVRRAA